MIELEVYAAGVRDLNKILELDHQLEAVPGLRYKVDGNHDIVYLEFQEPVFTIQEIRSLFRKLGLGATLGYIVGGILIGPHLLGLVGDPEQVAKAEADRELAPAEA